VANVRSFAFIRARGVHGLTTPVVVPHGFVYLVRFISVYANSTGGMSINFRDDGLGATWWHREWGTLDNHSVETEVRYAFNESESFNFEITRIPASGDTADVFAGGYVLTLP
jgi:hypothetical protein